MIRCKKRSGKRGDKMEKKVQIGMLFGIYGNLLTKRQQNILNDYANADLSQQQ